MQWAQKLLSTRGGTIALSAMAAVLAGVILLAYLHRYRESVNEASTEVTVLTANGLIKKGTSGDIIAGEKAQCYRHFDALKRILDREEPDYKN